MATAAVLSPATTLRLNPFYATVRFLSFRRKPLPTALLPSLLKPPQTPNPNPLFPPQIHTHYCVKPSFSGGRKFSSVIAAAISPEKAVEKQKGEVLGSDNEVKKFRKRLRIVDIKGGDDEGLDRLGENLVVRGWIRTLRGQSSVTFIEVNDGSCLSNMQCVVSSDAEGYDQVIMYKRLCNS
ncbi:OB domain-containing protein [Heracleum sosnowskyi]|uniref:OB domain-containing protein n=1 Tax=Heracleum sosnowskyi TaxID=360622 RepID=A0AAD8HXT2_9APIA|nr:OB domain-containing protein [Heracleum sosnowskyi]